MPVVGSTAYAQARAVTGLVRALLNDSGTLSVPVAITVISRNNANSTVTVTTATPHNLVAGDSVLIAKVPVGTLSFNGTFQVMTSAPNLNQFTYTQAGATEAQASGQVQGYGTGAVYTDAILIPYVNAVAEMLANELENVGNPSFIYETLLVVTAVAAVDSSVQVVLNDATAAPNQLPTNLISPLKIDERKNGTADDFVEMVNLTEHGGLPSQPQGQTLGVWEWRQEGIYFLGATVDTQIRLRYLGYFGDLTDGTSQLGLRNIRDALAFPAAVLAGGARGAQLAPEIMAAGSVSPELGFPPVFEQVIQRVTRQMQHKNYRLRGFSRRRGYGFS